MAEQINWGKMKVGDVKEFPTGRKVEKTEEGFLAHHKDGHTVKYDSNGQQIFGSESWNGNSHYEDDEDVEMVGGKYDKYFIPVAIIMVVIVVVVAKYGGA